MNKIETAVIFITNDGDKSNVNVNAKRRGHNHGNCCDLRMAAIPITFMLNSPHRYI